MLMKRALSPVIFFLMTTPLHDPLMVYLLEKTLTDYRDGRQPCIERNEEKEPFFCLAHVGGQAYEVHTGIQRASALVYPGRDFHADAQGDIPDETFCSLLPFLLCELVNSFRQGMRTRAHLRHPEGSILFL